MQPSPKARHHHLPAQAHLSARSKPIGIQRGKFVGAGTVARGPGPIIGTQRYKAATFAMSALRRFPLQHGVESEVSTLFPFLDCQLGWRGAQGGCKHANVVG